MATAAVGGAAVAGPALGGGWAFPRAPSNRALYLFYGGDIREDSSAGSTIRSPNLTWLGE